MLIAQTAVTSGRNFLHKSKTLTFAMAAHKTGPSVRGDAISLTYAPAIMAPAAMPKGMLSAAAIPIKAIPIVPAAPHDPRTIPTRRVPKKAMGKNISGLITHSP
ncbi:unknown [Eggerthella sp. CAG:1427]|nr:unknown [Eggerthella sp. CAG:1427]